MQFAASCRITLLQQQKLKSSDHLLQYRVTTNTQNNLLMRNRILIPIHNKRTNWLSTCKFINRYRLKRHLLHSGTLPLLFIFQSNLRNQSRIDSMILSINRTYRKSEMTKRPIRHSIQRRKYNTLPTTLSSISCLLSHEYNREVSIT